MQKTFIGPHLRRLRSDRKLTQGQMAKALGISPAYVNLLENNQRSVSVAVLLRLFEAYGVDWRDIAEDDDAATLADLKAVMQDPIFGAERPDLQQLRAALVHSPALVQATLRLHRAYLWAADQALSRAEEGGALIASTSPEAAVHNYFRRNRNHFPQLEEAAERFWPGARPDLDDTYSALKLRLRESLGLRTRLVPVSEMPAALRQYDEERREILLSEALDHTNRTFQLVHMFALFDQRALLDDLIARSELTLPRAVSRLRVELANYFAAAVLMPYAPFLTMARTTRYDIDHLATRFGVSFEQACQRATTLQREGAQGVPFFFLRIDKGGNVTKRFNSTGFHLAEYGGACPRLDVHASFRTPGRVLPQFVEMPDSSRYFVFSRTVDRPTFERHGQDNRQAVAMGCSVEHADQIGYAEAFRLAEARMTEIGINCRICPRANCDQRAHQAALHLQPIDEKRRGATRFDA
ncbi:ImmA/IrrE family metallo-endopeptidase [bacterium]|nr:ImmA/IrrE family metallo-endopeptidase [bacterium]